MATHPPRREALKIAVALLAPQVDQLRVCLNGYDAAPDFFADYDNIAFVIPEKDLGASGKTYWLDELDGYVFTVDDDIGYPPDYIEKMKLKVGRYGICCVHGSHIENKGDPLDTYIAPENRHHYRTALAEDEVVDMGGTGTMAWRTDMVRPPSFLGGIACLDPKFSWWCRKNGHKIVCIARDANWLQYKHRYASKCAIHRDERRMREAAEFVADKPWKEELVSVLMPAYNAEKYLRQSIDSILAQTYGAIELVIVDDCSTDGSWEIIKSYTDTRVRAFRLGENSGSPVAPLNRALKEAKGKIWARQDADDISLPSRIERQVRAGGVACTGGGWAIDGDGNKIKEPYTDRTRSLTGEKMTSNYRAFGPSRAIGGAIMWRVDIGEFDARFSNCGEDWNFLCRLAHEGGIAHVPDCYLYRAGVGMVANMNNKPVLSRDLRIAYTKERLSVKADAVILYRKDGGNELPYCVAGLRKYVSGLRDIYVIGDDPGIPGVIHIPHGDPNRHNKEANMARKVLAACDDDRISDPFLLCANDEIFIKPVSLKNYPLYWMDKTAKQSFYGKRIANTQKAIGQNYRYFDGHVPILIHKALYKEAMSRLPWDTDVGPGILCRTPYGCLLESRGAKLVKVRDPKKANCACDAPVVSKPDHIPGADAQRHASHIKVPRLVGKQGGHLRKRKVLDKKA